MRSCCATSLLALTVLVGQQFAPAPASAGEPLRLCLGALRTEGLSAEREEQTRRLVAEQLSALRVEIPTAASAVQLESGCFKVPGCVAKRVEGLNVHGVLDVLVRRVGPLVNVRLRLFNASNGLKLFETEFSSPAKSYPQPDQFRADLDRALDALRRQHPELGRAEPISDASADEVDDSLWGPLSIGALGIGGLALVSGAALGSWWLLLQQELGEQCMRDGDPRCIVGDGASAEVSPAKQDTYNGLGLVAPIFIGGGLAVTALGVAGLLVAGDE